MSGQDVLEVLRSRRSRPLLAAPAPDAGELRELLLTACTVPDHGRLRPWRFVVIEDSALDALGDAFASAHAERDPDASPAELARTRARPRRAPMIVAVVAVLREHPKVDVAEQRAAAVCATHALTLAAHLSGFGAMWRTGWYGEAPKVRAHLGLLDTEELTGWIYLGTPTGTAPAPREHVEPAVVRLS